MSFLSFLLGQKKTSASVAKDRLQLILINERGNDSTEPDFMPELQRELLEVISKYIKINPEDIKVNLDRHDSLEVLEVKIEMPQSEVRR